MVPERRPPLETALPENAALGRPEAPAPLGRSLHQDTSSTTQNVTCEEGSPTSVLPQARGAVSTKGDASADVNSRGTLFKDPSFLERGNVSHFFDGDDPWAFFKMVIPWHVVVGIGFLLSFLLSLYLPRVTLVLVASALILPFVIITAMREAGILRDPGAKAVLRPAMTDNLRGKEFCVFIQGARSNSPRRLTRTFKEVRSTFYDMVHDLEKAPGSVGYLGGESYVGTNLKYGSHVLNMTYWRSYDHMMRFVNRPGSPHRWARQHFMGHHSYMRDVGLWQEVYIVKPGQHESIYINCAPLGLGVAGGLVPALGKLASADGRVAASKGEEAS